MLFVRLPNEVTFECIWTTKLKVQSGTVTAHVYKRNAMSVPGVPSARARLDELLKSVGNVNSLTNVKQDNNNNTNND